MTKPRLGSRPRYVVVILGVATCLGAMVVYLSAGFALVTSSALGLLVLIGLVYGLVRWGDEDGSRSRIMRWTIIGFAAHLLFGLAVVNLEGVVRSYVAAPDAFAYHRGASALVRQWSEGFPAPDLPAGKEGYYYLLGAIYWFFGEHGSAGLAVNATLAAGLVPLVSDTTYRLFDRSATRYVAPVLVLLPGLMLWTSQLLKEAPILFLIAVAANCGVRLSQRFSFSSLLIMTISMASLFTFRAWVALVMTAGLLGALALAKRELVSGLGTGLGTLAIIAVLVLSLGLGYSGYRAAVQTDLEQADRVRQDLAVTAGTGYDPDADVSTPARAITYLPRGLVQFAFGPFPWQIRGARQLALVPDMLAMWMLLPSLWRGLRRGWSLAGRYPLVLLLPSLATGILLSLSVGNYGTQLRERLQVIVLLVPLIALGLSLRPGRPGVVSPTKPARDLVRT